MQPERARAGTPTLSLPTEPALLRCCCLAQEEELQGKTNTGRASTNTLQTFYTVPTLFLKYLRFRIILPPETMVNLVNLFFWEFC